MVSTAFFQVVRKNCLKNVHVTNFVPVNDLAFGRCHIRMVQKINWLFFIYVLKSGSAQEEHLMDRLTVLVFLNLDNGVQFGVGVNNASNESKLGMEIDLQAGLPSLSACVLRKKIDLPGS